MKTLPWIRINNKLTIVLENGQQRTILKDENEELFNKVIDLIKASEWDKIPDLLDTKTAIFNFSDGQFQVVNGVVEIQGKPVPNSLSKKIIDFVNEGLPYQPLLNFWNKLSKNPSMRNVQGLFDFLEINNYPITEDGDFIAYKKINEDWTDCYSGKILNHVGTTVSMPRNEVNDNPDLTCQSGFHCANWEFSWGFRSGRMIMVSVNPEHVVSMPTAYEFTKMRICQYYIINQVFKEEKGNFYKSEIIDNFEDDNDEDADLDLCSCEEYNCEDYDGHHLDCNCTSHPEDCLCSNF